MKGYYDANGMRLVGKGWEVREKLRLLLKQADDPSATLAGWLPAAAASAAALAPAPASASAPAARGGEPACALRRFAADCYRAYPMA